MTIPRLLKEAKDCVTEKQHSLEGAQTSALRSIAFSLLALATMQSIERGYE